MQKSPIRRKVGFEQYSDITKEGLSLLEEDSIHTTKLTTINIALKEIHKREDKR